MTQMNDIMKNLKRGLMVAVLQLEFLWFTGILIMLFMIKKTSCIKPEFKALYFIIIFCFIPLVGRNWIDKILIILNNKTPKSPSIVPDNNKSYEENLEDQT